MAKLKKIKCLICGRDKWVTDTRKARRKGGRVIGCVKCARERQTSHWKFGGKTG